MRFHLFPLRLRRLGRHLARAQWLRLAWWVDAGLLMLDTILLFDLYEWLSNAAKRQVRRLTPAEVQTLQTIYGPSLPYELIRIDERARLGPRSGRFCYVSFHTINCWGPMHDALLVHEAMHVWQYARFGAAYIGRALRAQRSPEGYNYGGGEALRAATSLQDFNFEQQGDIAADAYRLQQGRRPRWTDTASRLSDFAPYLHEIQQSPLPYGRSKSPLTC